MNFNWITTVFLAIILLPSCTDETPAEDTPPVETRTHCDCDDLEINMHYNRAHIYDTEAYFTGTCTIMYNGSDQVKESRDYIDGKMEGYVRNFHPDGSPEKERQFKNNMQHGYFKQWNSDGDLIYHATYKYGEIQKVIENHR